MEDEKDGRIGAWVFCFCAYIPGIQVYRYIHFVEQQAMYVSVRWLAALSEREKT